MIVRESNFDGELEKLEVKLDIVKQFNDMASYARRQREKGVPFREVEKVLREKLDKYFYTKVAKNDSLLFAVGLENASRFYFFRSFLLASGSILFSLVITFASDMEPAILNVMY